MSSLKLAIVQVLGSFVLCVCVCVCVCVLPRGSWDLIFPQPGMELALSALEVTTGPPGKFLEYLYHVHAC